MGVFDFPLSKLKTYEGINPKPVDFEEYWERGLREIETIDPQVQSDSRCLLPPHVGLL